MTSFEKALREAQQAGLKTFKWNGNYYTTKDKFDTHANTYVHAKQVKPNEISITTTAPYTKLSRTTPGFQPQDNVTDLVDKNGNTRVYFNRNNDMYYVTDNYGNIIGTTLDEKANRNGFREYESYTGSLQDLKKSLAARMQLEANMNEVNQKSNQKEDRFKRDFINSINNAKAQTANTIMQTINMPSHAIMGAVKLATDPDYKIDNYKKGFDINHSNLPLDQVNGVGDVLNINDPMTRHYLNSINGYSVLGTIKNSTAKLPHWQQRYIKVKNGRDINITGGNVIGGKANGKYMHGTKPHQEMGIGQYGAYNKWSGPSTRMTPIHVSPGSQLYTKVPIGPTLKGGSIVTNPTMYGTFTTPIIKQEEIPVEEKMHIIEHTGEGSNPTVINRLNTGDFVPGTTSPEFKGKGYTTVYTSDGNRYLDLGGPQMSNRSYISPQNRIRTGSHNLLSPERVIIK